MFDNSKSSAVQNGAVVQKMFIKEKKYTIF